MNYRQMRECINSGVGHRKINNKNVDSKKSVCKSAHQMTTRLDEIKAYIRCGYTQSETADIMEMHHSSLSHYLRRNHDLGWKELRKKVLLGDEK